jgi:20S proteasome alpha/beta subunit
LAREELLVVVCKAPQSPTHFFSKHYSSHPKRVNAGSVVIKHRVAMTGLIKSACSCVKYLLTVFVWLAIARGGSTSVLFGICTENAAYLSASSSLSHNGVTIKSDFNWVRRVGESLLGLQGDLSDCEEVFSFVLSKNSEHCLNFQGKPLSTKSIANLCRSLIAQRLRAQSRLNVNAIVAGWEGKDMSTSLAPKVGSLEGKPMLYWLDSIGSLHDSLYAVHGQESAFLLSMLDHARASLPSSSASCAATAAAAAAGDTIEGTRSCANANAGANADADANADLYALRLIGQCWTQLHQRSRSRIDLSSARVYRVQRSGCAPASALDLAEAPLKLATSSTDPDAGSCSVRDI